MTGSWLVTGSGGGGGGGGGAGAGGEFLGARWPGTTSSSSSGGCLVVSADLTSIIAFGSSQSASARSGLSEMSRDSLVYAPASSPSARMMTPVPAVARIMTLPLSFRSLRNFKSAFMSTQAAYSSVYIGLETVSSYRPSMSSGDSPTTSRTPCPLVTSSLNFCSACLPSTRLAASAAPSYMHSSAEPSRNRISPDASSVSRRT